MMEANYHVESLELHGDGCVDLRVVAKLDSETPPFEPPPCDKCGEGVAVVGGYCSKCDIAAEGNKLCPICGGRGILDDISGNSDDCPECEGVGEIPDPDAPKCVLCESTDVMGKPPMCGPCGTGGHS